MGDFYCEVCGNKDEELFGFVNGKPYCRLCVQFEGLEEFRPVFKANYENTRLDLPYELTEGQKRISNSIYKNLLKGRNCFISAVCGSGKTEIVIDVISRYLKKGAKIGFAIPRRDVVIELTLRIQSLFKNTKVISVYGGHKNVLDADIIVLTTHQLYRYNCFFDLLILDEADAFPYYRNDLLEIFLNKSINGPIIYLSATIAKQYEQKCKNVVYVNKRFHNHNLPIPIIIKYNNFNKIKVLTNSINSLKDKPILIFVPTIEIGLFLSNKIFVK